MFQTLELTTSVRNTLSGVPFIEEHYQKPRKNAGKCLAVCMSMPVIYLLSSYLAKPEFTELSPAVIGVVWSILDPTSL